MTLCRWFFRSKAQTQPKGPTQTLYDPDAVERLGDLSSTLERDLVRACGAYARQWGRTDSLGNPIVTVETVNAVWEAFLLNAGKDYFRF